MLCLSLDDDILFSNLEELFVLTFAWMLLLLVAIELTLLECDTTGELTDVP